MFEKKIFFFLFLTVLRESSNILINPLNVFRKFDSNDVSLSGNEDIILLYYVLPTHVLSNNDLSVLVFAHKLCIKYKRIFLPSLETVRFLNKTIDSDKSRSP